MPFEEFLEIFKYQIIEETDPSGIRRFRVKIGGPDDLIIETEVKGNIQNIISYKTHLTTDVNELSKYVLFKNVYLEPKNKP